MLNRKDIKCMICVNCGSSHTQKNGNHNGLQRYRCMNCNTRFDAGKYEENYFIHFNTKLKKRPAVLGRSFNYFIVPPFFRGRSSSSRSFFS